MGYPITPIYGIGRPEYSSAPILPISSPSAAGKTKIYWNGTANVDPNSYVIIIPVDPTGHPFPTDNKKFILMKIVASIEADTLIGIDLVHKYSGGYYIFASERVYQRIEINPEFYRIPTGDEFWIVCYNYDPTNARTFYIYFIGEEE